MLELDQQSTDALIRDTDALARAACTWVRQQMYEARFVGKPLNTAEEADLAAGFLAGLRLCLRLSDTEAMLVAYAYALMTSAPKAATETARQLISIDKAAVPADSGYLYGLQAAREFLDLKSIEQSPSATVYSMFGVTARQCN